MPNKQLLQSAGDGTAVPVGYVGEVIESNSTTAITTSASNGTSITLTPGVWMVQGSVIISADSTNRIITVGVSANSGSYTGATVINGGSAVAAYNTSSGVGMPIVMGRIVSVSSNTPYYLIRDTTSISGLSSTTNVIRATRIA